jgi:hypothetical protein
MALYFMVQEYGSFVRNNDCPPLHKNAFAFFFKFRTNSGSSGVLCQKDNLSLPLDRV